MTIRKVTDNIKKAISRTRNANLNTTVVLEACCYIDGLGKRLYSGSAEYRFKKYVENCMPKTFGALKTRSKSLGKKEDFCLHALWRDVRCGLVHEIDPKVGSRIVSRGKTIVHLNIQDKRKNFNGKDLILCSPRFVDDFLNSLALVNEH